MSGTTKSHPRYEATRPSRIERYRMRQQGLAAAAEAATGHSAAIDVLWAQQGDVFADRLDLAGVAQEAWWHGIMARLDASLDDDVSAMEPEGRYAAIRDAWAAQLRATPGYLPLAALGVGEPGHDAQERRYARVLALFAGAVEVSADDDVAVRAGLDLVRRFTDDHRPVSSNL